MCLTNTTLVRDCSDNLSVEIYIIVLIAIFVCYCLRLRSGTVNKEAQLVRANKEDQSVRELVASI